jgi:hypothetical protein
MSFAFTDSYSVPYCIAVLTERMQYHAAARQLTATNDSLQRSRPPRRAGDLPKPDAGTLSYSNPGGALFDQPPPPVLPMLAYVAVLYGQEPPDTSSSELSLSASEVVEIWEALF